MDLAARAHTIAGDRTAGASELLAALLPVLEEAIAAGPEATIDLARIVLEGQPAMAPLWHASAAAVAEFERPGTFASARAGMERAPRTLVRAASRALGELLVGERAPLILTVSYSSSVARVLAELTASAEAAAVKPFRGLRVICGEGQPGLEGKRLASDLSTAGVEATVVIDAALTRFLSAATAVVMGADAVCAERWINKVGSFGVAAAASFTGTPAYVIASRDKFVPSILEARLSVPPLFEFIPAELATLLLTEAGPLSPADLAHAVERGTNAISLLLSQLRRR